VRDISTKDGQFEVILFVLGGSLLIGFLAYKGNIITKGCSCMAMHHAKRMFSEKMLIFLLAAFLSAGLLNTSTQASQSPLLVAAAQDKKQNKKAIPNNTL